MKETYQKFYTILVKSYFYTGLEVCCC